MTNRPPDDPGLRRIERDSAIACAALTLLALPFGGWRPAAPLGVLAGAALMAFSYRVIRGGVDAIVSRAGSSRAGEAASRSAGARQVAWALTRFVTRYGVLAVAAWAILVPLRANPLAVFVGVSVPVLAIGIEAVRHLRSPGR